MIEEDFFRNIQKVKGMDMKRKLGILFIITGVAFIISLLTVGFVFDQGVFSIEGVSENFRFIHLYQPLFRWLIIDITLVVLVGLLFFQWVNKVLKYGEDYLEETALKIRKQLVFCYLLFPILWVLRKWIPMIVIRITPVLCIVTFTLVVFYMTAIQLSATESER